MFIDMHSHSVASDDSRATVEQYLKWINAQRKKGFQIDGIVLTEHRQFDAENDYSDLKSLLKRLSQPDAQCGKCSEYYRGVIQIRQAKKGYQENSAEATLQQHNNCKR